MGLSRNERRKRAKARRIAKLERMAKAHLASEAQARRDIVSANLASPRPERNFYRGTISSVYGGNHAPRAIGGAPQTGIAPKPRRDRLRSLGDKGKYHPAASWPVVQK